MEWKGFLCGFLAHSPCLYPQRGFLDDVDGDQGHCDVLVVEAISYATLPRDRWMTLEKECAAFTSKEHSRLLVGWNMRAKLGLFLGGAGRRLISSMVFFFFCCNLWFAGLGGGWRRTHGRSFNMFRWLGFMVCGL